MHIEFPNTARNTSIPKNPGTKWEILWRNTSKVSLKHNASSKLYANGSYAYQLMSFCIIFLLKASTCEIGSKTHISNLPLMAS